MEFKTKSWLFLFIASICLISPVFADDGLTIDPEGHPIVMAHDTDVTITPNVAKCGDMPEEYKVNVLNLDLPEMDNIREVRIYRDVDGDGYADPGILAFECGLAPEGWTLDDRTALYHYCQYETTIIGGYMIEPGENLDFTFNAKLDNTCYGCDVKFKVSTIDDVVPEGQVRFKFPAVKIDCTPPEIEKTLGTPGIGVCPPDTQEEGEVCWINQENVIHVHASDLTDVDSCNLGFEYLDHLKYCDWSYTVDGGDLHSGTEYPTTGDPHNIYFDIQFEEDSVHELTITCEDVAGNKTTDVETFKVESVPPFITKTLEYPEEAIGACPPTTRSPFETQSSEKFCWIKQNNTIHVEANDLAGSQCNSGFGYCDWSYTVDEVSHDSGTAYPAADPYNISFDIQFNEDSEHLLTITCYDMVGNKTEDIELFKVDSTPPETTKEYGTPFFDDGFFHYITTQTPITLTAVDGGDPCHIDGVTTYYRYCLSNCYTEGESLLNCTLPPCTEGCCCDDDWLTYNGPNGTGPFTIDQESEHCIEFYGEDLLGNKEVIQSQCVYVEDTPPEATKTLDGSEIPYNDRESVLILENKDASWKIIEDKIQARLEYNEIGPEFNYSLTATGLQADTKYSLIYYADFDPSRFDTWGGHNPGALITTVPADEFGEINTSGSTDLGMNLPSNPDWNIDPYPDYCGGHNGFDYYEHCSGAKIWLVLADDYDENNKKVNKWNPTEWLFETDLITHTSADYYWVTDETQITLACDDSWNGKAPHPVDHEQVCYKVSFDDPQTPWLTGEYCTEFDGTFDGEWCCADASDNDYSLHFTEDSMHDLEFYCIDALGNDTEIDLEYFRVDSQKPIIERTLDGPEFGDCVQDHTGECWIMDWTDVDGTTILINAYDDTSQICAVDQIECKWWYDLDGKQMDGENGLPPQFEIKFYEDTVHTLYVECKDALGNTETYSEVLYVDSQGPTVEKEFIGPQKIDGLVEWIDGITTIELKATDLPDAVCAVGEDKIYYVITPMDEMACRMPEEYCSPAPHQPEDFTGYTEPIGGIEESCHMLEFYAEDKLGNIGPIGANCFFVDHTAPLITKDNGEAIFDTGETAFRTDANPDGNFHWITSGMPITFTCTDQGPHPSGDENLCFKVSYDLELVDGYLTDEYCSKYGGEMDVDECCIQVDPQNQFVFNFNEYEDSLHDLEYYCEDAVEKKSEIEIQYYKVDTTEPDVNIVMHEPFYGTCPSRLSVLAGTLETLAPQPPECFVDTATRITLDFKDGGEICAVNEVECHWGYRIDEGELNGWFDYNADEGIDFPVEGYHFLEIECEDALGNKWVSASTGYFMEFRVDHTPPIIEKWYTGPQYPNPIDLQTPYPHWINSTTLVNVTAHDEGLHQSGVKDFSVTISRVDDMYCNDKVLCQDAVGTNPIVEMTGGTEGETLSTPILEESCHLIEIYAEDNVGKNTTHKQCVFVDNTAPTPKKDVEGPKTEWFGDDDYYPGSEAICQGMDCWLITTMTPITLSCLDEGEHPVNNSIVHWRIWWDKTGAWTDWSSAPEGKQIYIDQECLHELQFYCSDALDNNNMDAMDDEWFKVEGKPFTITLNKKWNLISVPFVLTPDITEIFSDINKDIESVWSYDAKTDQWFVYRPDDLNASNLETMIPGWGYWVKAKEDVNLVIGGSLFSPATSMPSKGIEPGWNLIGYYGNDSGDLVYDGPFGQGKEAYCALFSLGESYSDKGWSTLLTYWGPSQWIELDYYNNMDPGAGYWILALEDAIYGYTTTCGGPY